MRKSKAGYTLTELIVVVAILGVLAAVATPIVVNQVGKARDAADAANARSIENAIKVAVVNGDLDTQETSDGSGIFQIKSTDVSEIITNTKGIPGDMIAESTSGSTTTYKLKACQDTSNYFFLNRQTYEVRVASESPDGNSNSTLWVKLN
jgi:type IV pilus assembly protein PilA